MNKRETIALMAVMEAAYPAFYKQAGRAEKETAANLWAEMFAEDDAVLVAGAVKAFIAGDKSGFPPTIGQIKGRMRELIEPEQDTAADAWNAVHKAVRSGCLPRHFDALPEMAKQVVGSYAQLKEMGQMSTNDFNTVAQSNFLRSYRAKEKAVREYGAVPNSVKALVAGLCGQDTFGKSEQRKLNGC